LPGPAGTIVKNELDVGIIKEVIGFSPGIDGTDSVSEIRLGRFAEFGRRYLGEDRK